MLVGLTSIVNPFSNSLNNGNKREWSCIIISCRLYHFLLISIMFEAFCVGFLLN